MIITISGMPGSGKSTLAKYLSKVFKLKYYGMGDLRRQIARKKGFDINGWNKCGEKNPITDIEVDNFLKTLNKKKNLVIDGRMAFHFVPNSIKIFIKVTPKVGAKRIFDTYRGSEKYKNLEDAKTKLQRRVKSDNYRYQKYYHMNIFDLSHYDIIFDTTNMPLEEAKKTIKQSVEKYIKEIGMSISEVKKLNLDKKQRIRFKKR
jgi:cytidylate kinase